MNDYQRLFLSLGKERAPAYLLSRIQEHVHREDTRRAKERLILFSILLISALVALIPALQALRIAAIESGFSQFLALLFSDAQTLLSSWPSYTLSLLETLPVMGLILVLTILFILVDALALTMKNAKLLIYTPTA